MSDARSIAQRGHAYFSRAATLRFCIHFNQEDYRFARTGQIAYIVDANVVRFFIDPVREAYHLAVIDTADPDTAVVTAEFLFAGGLAGQRDLPVYIAPAHGLEIQLLVEKLTRMDFNFTGGELPDGLALQTGPAKLKRALDRLVDRVDSGTLDYKSAVAGLGRMIAVGDRVLFGSDGRASEFTQLFHLSRIYREGRARPLDSHPDSTPSILYLKGDREKRRVSDWEELLRAEHEKVGREVEASALRRDAEVLAQVQLLNESADSSLRFVLVTADQVLFDAYARWYWEDRRRSAEGAPFMLRALAQYIPIINVKEMPNLVEKSEMIADTRDALDSLLTAVRLKDGGYPRVLALYRALSREKTELHRSIEDLYGFDPLSFSDEDQQRFKAAGELWRHACREGAVLNGELINRRYQGLFNKPVQLLRSRRNFSNKILEVQQRLLHGVERDHLIFSLGTVIYLLGKRTEPRAWRDNAVWTRPALREQFAEIIQGVAPVDALAGLAQGDHTLMQQARAALDELDGMAFFFAAWLAHCCGLWDAAWHYARRAADPRLNDAPVVTGRTHRRTPCSDEIQYILASAARCALRLEGSDLNEALDRLDDLAAPDDRGRDPFGFARAVCERTSLLLTIRKAQILLAEEPTPGTFRSFAASVADRPLDHLSRQEFDALRHHAPDDLVDLLDTQNDANAVGSAIVSLVLGPGDAGSYRPWSVPGDTLRPALSRLDPHSRLRSPILAAEYAICRLALDELAVEEAWTIFRDARERAAAYRMQMTDLEVRELAHLEKCAIWSVRTERPSLLPVASA